MIAEPGSRATVRRGRRLYPVAPSRFPQDSRGFAARWLRALSRRLASLGYKLNEAELNRAFERFKLLADKKKEVFDEDLATIVEDELTVIPEVYHLEDFHVTSGTKVAPAASIRLKKNKKILEASSTGDGPIDACYKAIDKITGARGRLKDYGIHSVTSGKDAIGEVSVRIEVRRQDFSGRGASTDIIEASIKAYLNAINKAHPHNKNVNRTGG
mgnify:CR=1 FL=1